MCKRLTGLSFSLLFVAGLLYGQAAMGCTTQTIVSGDRVIVCTFCKTITTCV